MDTEDGMIGRHHQPQGLSSGVRWDSGLVLNLGYTVALALPYFRILSIASWVFIKLLFELTIIYLYKTCACVPL